MKQFGKRSLGNLESVHPALVQIANLALQLGGQDFTVICGTRNKTDQNAAYAAKMTTVKYPNSPHNALPSCAIDVIPYPFTSWEDKAAFVRVADQMFRAAKMLGLELRWGGDFNRDGDKTTKDSWDSPHFELHPWRSFRKAKR